MLLWSFWHTIFTPFLLYRPTVQHNVLSAASADLQVFLANKKDTTTDLAIISPSRRFPKYNTPDFAAKCSWSVSDTMTKANNSNKCYLMVEPTPNSNEGISDWLNLIAMSAILAKQMNCQILLNYGSNVDLTQVVAPIHSQGSIYNWTVPSLEYKCSLRNGCDRVQATYQSDHIVSNAPTIKRLMHMTGENKPIAGVPFYRFGFNTPIPSSEQLSNALPGFELDTGMACALGNLLQLSTRAADIEPKLFNTILPTLRDPESLVFAIYIRTGNAEPAKQSSLSKQPNDSNQDDEYLRRGVQCALGLESEYLSDRQPDDVPILPAISKVVWFIASDSTSLKNRAIDLYSSKDVNTGIPQSQRKYFDRVIPREILVTSSQGKHTKPSVNPTTNDFAEAFLDWYLIGESDVVFVQGSYTFGVSAALRTATPVMKRIHNACERIHLKKSR